MMMLLNRMLKGAAYAEKPKVTVVYNDVATVNANTWTLTSKNFGPLAQGQTTRHLIAAVTCYSQSADTTSSDDGSFSMGVSIGGSTATIYNSLCTATNDAYNSVSTGSCFAILENNSSTSGNIVVTLSGYSDTMQYYGVTLFRVVGLASAAPITQPTTGTLVVPIIQNGFGILAATNLTYGATCAAFTGTGAITTYYGTYGAVMYRTTADSVTHASSGANYYRGTTWEFVDARV